MSAWNRIRVSGTSNLREVAGFEDERPQRSHPIFRCRVSCSPYVRKGSGAACWNPSKRDPKPRIVVYMVETLQFEKERPKLQPYILATDSPSRHLAILVTISWCYCLLVLHRNIHGGSTCPLGFFGASARSPSVPSLPIASLLGLPFLFFFHPPHHSPPLFTTYQYLHSPSPLAPISLLARPPLPIPLSPHLSNQHLDLCTGRLSNVAIVGFPAFQPLVFPCVRYRESQATHLFQSQHRSTGSPRNVETSNWKAANHSAITQR